MLDIDRRTKEENAKILDELKIYYLDKIESFAGYNLDVVLGFRKDYGSSSSDYVIFIKFKKKYKNTGYHSLIEKHYLSECQLKNITRINKLRALNGKVNRKEF